jgi:undecaprenyl-diphosphatase
MQSTRNQRVLLFAVVISLVSLIVLCIISYFFIDQPVFEWLVKNNSGFKKGLFLKGFEMFGRAWLLIWLLLCWVFLADKRRPAAIGIIALFLLAFSVIPAKALIKRSRPDDIIRIRNGQEISTDIAHRCSFPSGDTASVFSVVTAVAPLLSLPVVIGIYSVAFCIGVLRVLSFAHFPSDIFAGAALGIFSGYLSYRLYPFMVKKIDLTSLINRKFALFGIILIPVIVALSEGPRELYIFLLFYPPLVIIVYLIFRCYRLIKLYNMR